MNETTEKEVPIEISPEVLSEEVLLSIIENFILREGTDYGWVEVSYDKKAQQIRNQMSKGEIKVVFDVTTETVSLLTVQAWSKLSRAQA